MDCRRGVWEVGLAAPMVGACTGDGRAGSAGGSRGAREVGLAARVVGEARERWDWPRGWLERVRGTPVAGTGRWREWREGAREAGGGAGLSGGAMGAEGGRGWGYRGRPASRRARASSIRVNCSLPRSAWGLGLADMTESITPKTAPT